MYLEKAIHIKLIFKTVVAMRIRNTSTTSSIHHVQCSLITYFNKLKPLMQYVDEVVAILPSGNILVAFNPDLGS